MTPGLTSRKLFLGRVHSRKADRVVTMKARNKAYEAAKGGPLGNECNAVAGVHGHNPVGSSLFAPMAALHLLAWGPPRLRQCALPWKQTGLSATACLL